MAARDTPDDDPAAKRRKRGPGRPPITEPTPRQLEILEFVRAVSQAGRRPPTIDEIRRHLRFRSTYAVRTHLLALERKGLLHIARNSHRGISLAEEEDAARDGSRLVPLLGDAPAGTPLEAMERADEHIALDPGLFPQAEIFAIRVRGDSMRDAGIHDRDLALIRPGPDAGDGDLVLARINNEVTLKRLRFDRGVPYLHPENAEYADIRVRDGDDFTIVGTVAGIIRKY